MARKPSKTLTEAELRVMDALWKQGQATVAEVAAALPATPALAYNTVLTTLRILEAKGFVRHTKLAAGRAYLYHPRVNRTQAARSAVGQLVGRFFDNSRAALVLNLLEDEPLDDEERRKIRRLLEEPEARS